jgi:DNA-binding XRE family transcriptional regulator
MASKPKPNQWESNAAPWLTPGLCRAARGILGWSQRDLASKANVGVSTVADFERARRDPILPVRLQIVFAFTRARVRFCRGTGNGKARRMTGVQLLG